MHWLRAQEFFVFQRKNYISKEENVDVSKALTLSEISKVKTVV